MKLPNAARIVSAANDTTSRRTALIKGAWTDEEERHASERTTAHEDASTVRRDALGLTHEANKVRIRRDIKRALCAERIDLVLIAALKAEYEFELEEGPRRIARAKRMLPKLLGRFHRGCYRSRAAFSRTPKTRTARIRLATAPRMPQRMSRAPHSAPTASAATNRVDGTTPPGAPSDDADPPSARRSASIIPLDRSDFAGIGGAQ